MDAEKRTAFALRAKRYIREKTATPETARRTLIELGIYTEDGKVSPEYGGSGRDDAAQRLPR